MSFTLIIEPMNPQYKKFTRVFQYNSYNKALSAFKERCDELNYQYDTVDKILFPCEWQAGGLFHDYKINLTVDAFHNNN